MLFGSLTDIGSIHLDTIYLYICNTLSIFMKTEHGSYGTNIDYSNPTEFFVSTMKYQDKADFARLIFN